MDDSGVFTGCAGPGHRARYLRAKVSGRPTWRTSSLNKDNRYLTIRPLRCAVADMRGTPDGRARNQRVLRYTVAGQRSWAGDSVAQHEYEADPSLFDTSKKNPTSRELRAHCLFFLLDNPFSNLLRRLSFHSRTIPLVSIPQEFFRFYISVEFIWFNRLRIESNPCRCSGSDCVSFYRIRLSLLSSLFT